MDAQIKTLLLFTADRFHKHNFQSLQVTILPVVKEVITSRHVITWRYLLLPFKQLHERTLMYIQCILQSIKFW